jgi:hypothetical protein
MGLKAILEKIDDLPEETKSLYSEQKSGDKTVYVLDVEDIDNHPKVRGVITANRENVRKRDEYKTKVEELEGKVANLPEDFDPDEWARLKAGDGGKPDEALQALKDQHARAVETLKAKHAKDLADKDALLSERDGYIDRTLIDGGLKDALLDVGVNPDLMDGALASLRGSVKVQKADDGNRTAIVETDLGDVPVVDFVKEWAGAKGKAYLGKATGPGGEGNNGGGRGGIKTQGGDFGGDKSARTKAIASKFPELAGN